MEAVKKSAKLPFNIYSFFAEWFRDIKGSVFKVELTNQKEVDLGSVDKSFEKVLGSLEELKKGEFLTNVTNKELFVSVNNIKLPDETKIHKKIDSLIVAVKSLKFEEDSRLAPLLESLVSLAAKTRVVELADKKVEVSFPETQKVVVENLPKVQKVEGSVSLDKFEKLIDGMQAIFDKLEELRVELPKGVGGGGVSVTGGTGSYKEKTKGTVLYDPDDSTPTYVGTHDVADADTADSKWEILKYSYSGSNVIKIVRRIGSWDSRASLF